MDLFTYYCVYPNIRWSSFTVSNFQDSTYKEYVWLCEFLCFHSGAVEVSILLWCGTMPLPDWCLMFQDSMLGLSSGIKSPKEEFRIPLTFQPLNAILTH